MSTPLEKHVYLGLSEISSAELTSENTKTSHLTEKKAVKVLNFKATELRLGLPGSESPERVKFNDGNDNDDGNVEFNGVNLLVKNMVSGAKRGFSVAIHGTSNKESTTPAASRAQLVGWPPVRSFRKNSMAINAPKTNDNQDSKSKSEIGCHYIKVSMDGAPYLRKIDLKTFGSYVGLSSALETMFSGFTMSQYGNKGHLCADERSEGRLIDSLQRSEYVLTYEDKDGDWMLVGDVPWNMFINTCKRLRIMKSSEAVGLTSRVSNG